MTRTQVNLPQVLTSGAAPRAKAQAVASALTAGAGEGVLRPIYRNLRSLRPAAPRSGAEAAPFLSMIAAAHSAGQTELASALGLLLRGHVIPRDPKGPAGRYLTQAKITDLASRGAIWRTARALGQSPRQNALRQHYAKIHPYWRDPRPGQGARVLLLNRLPNFFEDEARFVHNQSNVPHGYEEHGSSDGFVFDVFFMVGTDFAAIADQIEPPTVVYNNILGAETLLNEGYGDVMHQIAAHFGVPLLNPPEACTPYTRSGNYERIGEQAHYAFPKTFRFEAGFDPDETADQIEAGFDWPVILRDHFGHMGSLAVLARSRAEVVDALTQLKGRGAYAIQFHDYRQQHDLYFRYRIFRIGQEVFPSRIHVAEGWNVHGKEHDALKESRPDLKLADLEIQYWEDPTSLVPKPTWDALVELVRSTGTDVMGCDFTLAPDGRALIFELNPSMHVPRKGRRAFETLCGFQRPLGDLRE